MIPYNCPSGTFIRVWESYHNPTYGLVWMRFKCATVGGSTGNWIETQKSSRTTGSE
jgi:hypothetical protein